MPAPAPSLLPPHADEAERGVLGSMLRDNGTIPDVLQIFKDETNFYKDAHRKVFVGISALFDRGHPVDLITLGDELKQRAWLEEIGGLDYIVQLLEDAPTAAHAEYYARIVRDKAILRNLIAASHENLREAHSQSGPAEEILEAAERRIFEIAEWGVVGQPSPLAQPLTEAFDRLDQRIHRDSDSSVSGLPTGYIDLDKITAGLQDSELVIVAARPSVGKTAFSLNLVRHIAIEEKAPVFFVSLEQSRIELAERLLSAQASVDSHRLRVGRISDDDHRRIVQASGPLREAKIYIDDSPGQNMLRIAANARRIKMKHGLRAVFVDYLQLVEPDPQYDSRQEQVAAISRRLKAMAKELKVPVVACAQLNRGVELRAEGEPKLADLRESGSIEQDADTVMLLHRPRDQSGQEIDAMLEIIVAKQRNGPTGKIVLTHLKQYMRFDNYAGQWPL
ncbi:MAG TPA: replicative DNA helicase [Gemmatales bacterium]|nr:replicative DNA helicase [Gemmatales bacterium]